MHPIAAVQSEYSLWTRNPELGLIQACAETGALLVAFSPLGRGYFTGLCKTSRRSAKGLPPANPRFQGLNWRRNRDRLPPFLALAEGWGAKPATLAIAWTLARAPHVVPIPGTRAADHLAECAEAADFDLRGADRRNRARSAGRLRRRRAIFRPAMGRNPEILNQAALRRRERERGASPASARRNGNGPARGTPNSERMPSSRRRAGAPSTSAER